MNWFDFLFPPRTDEIVLRGTSLDEFMANVVPLIMSETRPGTVSLLQFSTSSVRAVIHEAKYHGSTRAFLLLGSALADYIRDCDDVGRTASDIRFVPVPLGEERLRERGFNQAEEVAKLSAQELGIKMETGLLVRTRETVSQVLLPRNEREKNMRGAFKATRRADPACTYIVIDDVITTGATLQAAIDALKNAGAEHIIPLALAH